MPQRTISVLIHCANSSGVLPTGSKPIVYSTPEWAAQAAQAEIGASADLVLGPVFAVDVRQAASVAKAANKPMIAFRLTPAWPRRGVYLRRFLIEGYVGESPSSPSRGKKSFAVMAPQSEYGNVALAQFQQTAGRLNTPGARHRPLRAGPAAERGPAGLAAGQIDALFIPEQADGMPAVASALASTGSRPSSLASASGTTPASCGCPELQGAWFAAPDNTGFQRARAALQGEIRRRADAVGDVVLCCSDARGRARPETPAPTVTVRRR